MDDPLFDFLFEGGPINAAMFEELFGPILGGRSGQPEKTKKLEELTDADLRELVADEVRKIIMSDEFRNAMLMWVAIGVKLYWQATMSMLFDAITWPIRTLGKTIAWPISAVYHFASASRDWRGAEAAIAINDTMPFEVRRMLNARGFDLRIAPGVRSGVRFGRWLNNYFFPQDVEEDGEYESEEGNDGEGDDPQNDDGLGDAV